MNDPRPNEVPLHIFPDSASASLFVLSVKRYFPHLQQHVRQEGRDVFARDRSDVACELHRCLSLYLSAHIDGVNSQK